jgi:hypothetical protein
MMTDLNNLTTGIWKFEIIAWEEIQFSSAVNILWIAYKISVMDVTIIWNATATGSLFVSMYSTKFQIHFFFKQNYTEDIYKLSNCNVFDVKALNCSIPVACFNESN